MPAHSPEAVNSSCQSRCQCRRGFPTPRSDLTSPESNWSNELNCGEPAPQGKVHLSLRDALGVHGLKPSGFPFEAEVEASAASMNSSFAKLPRRAGALAKRSRQGWCLPDRRAPLPIQRSTSTLSAAFLWQSPTDLAQAGPTVGLDNFGTQKPST